MCFRPHGAPWWYKNGTNSMTPVRCCTEITNWAKETFGIAVFIGQVTKNGVFAGKNTILHMIDVHAQLVHDTDPRSPTHDQLLFSVTKNRFGYTGKSYAVTLGKTGLSVLSDLSDIEVPEVEEEDEDQIRPRRTRSGIDVKVPPPPAAPASNEG